MSYGGWRKGAKGNASPLFHVSREIPIFLSVKLIDCVMANRPGGLILWLRERNKYIATPEDITYHSPERNASNEEVDDGEMVPIGMPQSDLYIQPEDHDQYQQRRTLFTVFYQDDQEWARELESFDWEGFREHLPDDMVKHRYEYLRGNSEPLIIDID